MQVEIIKPNGGSFRQVIHEGQRYLVAPTNGRYHIRLTNNSFSRRLAVVSVDGLSVMDGKPASSEDSGYVLNPYESIDIKGWRRTNDEVAEFKFGAQKDSYSAKSGQGTRNTSVIGIAVFDEKSKPEWSITRSCSISLDCCDVNPLPPHTTYTTGGTSGSTGGAGGMGASGSTISCYNSSSGGASGGSWASSGRGGQTRRRVTKEVQTSSATRLGTGYGKKAEMKVRTVTFERATEEPVEVTTIVYGTKRWLKETYNIDVDQCESPITPDPFPADRVACEPPPGWNG